MLPKLVDAIGLQEAMDNLAAIAMINMDNPPPIGIFKKHRIITEEGEFGPETVQWLSAEGTDSLLNVLDATYRAIQTHLENLYTSSEMDWGQAKSRKGVAAMMSLIGDSANKMNVYLAYRLGKALDHKIEEREAFRSLQHFYTQKLSQKFSIGIEGGEAWGAEWLENKEAPALDSIGSGLKDFETIQKDREYELFYIRNEEGAPYFTSDLLRNVKLTVNFDAETESFEEDPLLKVRVMADRDLHASAGQILRESHSLIEDFYKIARKLKGNDLAESLSMAVIALFLAANPRYLIQNTKGKSCLHYFSDFHRFLRRSMKTSEYQKLIAYPPHQSDRNAHTLLHLTHQLCQALFFREGGVKQEAIGLIHRTMRRGEDLQLKKQKGITIWDQLLLDDEKFRSLLVRFPSGPLFKILDLIREEEEGDISVPFDPIGQENLPSHLFDLHHQGKKRALLRLPCPTRQSVINKAEIVDEFRGLLRFAGRKYLVLNFQDRTSWKEEVRCQAIESLQKNAEFSTSLSVLTLPKDTDFYHQSNRYLNLNQAVEFLNAFQDQLFSSPNTGFFFPPQWKESEIKRFAQSLLPIIHECFFDGKNSLTRQARVDFIEIFYQFLILKVINQINPDAIFFSCKDAIDTSATASAIFYSFIRLLSGGFSTKEEHDFFRWLLYTPALFIRERGVDSERVLRGLTSLERIGNEMEERGPKLLKAFGPHYQKDAFKGLEARHL